MCQQMKPERISHLIANSLLDSLSPEEDEELRCWAEKSPGNKQLLESLGDIGPVEMHAARVRAYDTRAGWRRVEHRYRCRRMVRVVFPMMGLAAGLVLLAGIFLPGADAPVQVPEIARAGPADASAVQLVRASGEVITVDTMRTIDLEDAVVESDGRSMTVVPRAAAEPGLIAYNEVSVPVARRFEVTLADGTRVTLNAGSTLKFPEKFPPTGAREVYLSGEAFFDVEKDAAHPFIVHAGTGYVRVLGTAFNVNCYDDAPSLVTTLVEGRVAFGGEMLSEEISLTPGMQAVHDRRSGTVTTADVDVSEFTGWRQGLFSFREQLLPEILKTVARWYGCRVVYENPCRADVSFTGKISQSSTLAEIAGYFSRTGEVLVTEEQGVLVIH